MRRHVAVWASALAVVAAVCGSGAHAAANTTALCEAATCLLANGTTCDRQTQRCPPCLALGRLPNEFSCVAYETGTTKCSQPTTLCAAEAVSSLVQGHAVSVVDATTAPPQKANAATTSKPDTRAEAADTTATPSPLPVVLAVSTNESALASQSPLASTKDQSPNSNDLTLILTVFSIIIGVLLLLIAAILIKRYCEKQQIKHRQAAVMAQLPGESASNSDDSKHDVSPDAGAYDSYSSSLDTIPLPRRARPRGVPLPRPRNYVDGRKYAQPLNAPLRQHSSSSQHSKTSPPKPPRRPPMPPVPPPPPTLLATTRSDTSEEFQTMLSARSEWIDVFHADLTTRENPPLLTSSLSTIPILSHPVRTESADSHDDIDIYPESTDGYPDTESFHTGGTEGRMFSPISSRRQDSIHGIDL